MNPTTEQMQDAVTALLDAERAASKWSNPSYTPEAQQAKRAEMMAPTRASLAQLVPGAQSHAAQTRAALSSALDAALTGYNDNSRIVAREAVWPRLRDRLAAGESIETMARTSSNPLELEALATIAPAEMARLTPNGVHRSAEEWAAEVREAVDPRYLELPETSAQFVELGDQAAKADTTGAWADLGGALLEGKRGADVGGTIYTRLLRADDSATPVYDLLMGR